MESEDAWKDFHAAQEILKGEEKEEDTVVRCINCDAKETDFLSTTSSGDVVCSICGTVQHRIISDSAEWNNYNEGGPTQTARCSSAWGAISQFENTSSIAVPKGLFSDVKMPDGTTRRIDLSRYNNQLQYTYKQKSYYDVACKIDRASENLGVPKAISDTAKRYWSEIMQVGKLTRAAVRRGVIANCLSYACIYHKVPREAHEVADAFEINTKEITKGDKVFREIFEGTKWASVLYETVGPEHLFTRCRMDLNLDFSVERRCKEILQECKLVLSSVAPKSAVGGILAWVIKNELNQRVPTKADIAKAVQICSPSLNKSLKLVKNYYDSK